MTVKFFGQFLLERGDVDAAQLREALELMLGENLSLGELAVRERILTRHDADHVNAEQRTVDRPFGALAVEMGLLSHEQLDKLVHLQQQTRLPLGEALVRLGHLRGDRLGELLDEFKVDQSSYEARASEMPPQLAERRLAPVLLELLPRFCLRMARLRVKVAPAAALERPITFAYHASVRIGGDEPASITLAGDRDFAVQIAAGASGFDAETIEEWFIADSMGEFLNVVVGNAMAVLEREGLTMTLDPVRLDLEPASGTVFDLVATEGRGALVYDPSA